MSETDVDQSLLNDKLRTAIRKKTATEIKIENIQKCLDEGANVNAQYPDYSNNTALHFSVIMKEKEIVKYLLENGANVDCKNTDGRTALDIANKLNNKNGKDIVRILESFSEEAHMEAVQETEILTSIDKSPKKVKAIRREGTASVHGQLYESKLISMVFFRACTFANIGQFLLGSNLSEVGDLDDICIRYKQEGKDVMIFIQAKHKIKIDKGKITVQDLWKEAGEFSLPKYFKSYMDVRQKFDEKNKDNILFQAQYENLKCYFILYTTAKDDLSDKKCISHNEDMDETTKRIEDNMKKMIRTGKNSDIFQYRYEEKDIDLLSKIMLVKLVQQMGTTFLEIIQDNRYNNDSDNSDNNTIKSKTYENIMRDTVIRKFHVILAQKVINVSKETKDGHRTGTFREEFFSSDEELLIALKRTLYSEAVKNKKIQNEQIETFLQYILLNPCASTISELIGNIITYNTNINRLEISNKTYKQHEIFEKYLPELQKLQVMESDAIKAFEIAGRRELGFKFNLPVTFGNRDLKLPKEPNVEKKLIDRTKTITNMINNSTDKKIIINNHKQTKCIEDAVGNLLTFDVDSKSLKFNMNTDTLENYAKILLDKLKANIEDLDSYRLSINTFGFPRVSFDSCEYDKCFARDFLNNLWFFTCQAKEDKIERTVKKEIQEHYNANNNDHTLFRVKSEAIFLKFHDVMQKWWMLEPSKAYYLTNNDIQIYHDISNYFLECPLLNVLNFIYINKTKKNGIEFNIDAINPLLLDEGRGLKIIETNANILSGMKLLQYFNDRSEFKFLDLDYLLSLHSNNFDDAINEINNKNALIVLCENTSKAQDVSKLKQIVQKSDETKVIVVTRKYIAMEIENCLPEYMFSKVRDERNSLTDLNSASQENVLNTTITFQGEKMPLEAVCNPVVLNELKPFIKGEVLSRMINGNGIKIGKAITDYEYDEIKEYYIPRRLSKYFRRSGVKMKINTLEDHNRTIAILAKQGRGKSIYLTHLSTETKKEIPNIWIERINLLEHRKQFQRWQEEDTAFDKKEALRFICKRALSVNLLSDDDCFGSNVKIEFDVDLINDVWVTQNTNKMNDLKLFELELFIRSCNQRNTIFIFDGFEEIFPQYAGEVINLIKYTSEEWGRVWITSCPSYAIEKILSVEIGADALWTLVPPKHSEQKRYYRLFFENNLNLTELNNVQLRNVDSLFEYVRHIIENGASAPIRHRALFIVHIAAIEHFSAEIKHTPLTPDNEIFTDKWDISNIDISAVPIIYSAVPRHMFKLCDYFQQKIKDTGSTHDIFIWSLNSLCEAFPTLRKEIGSFN